MRLKYCTVLLFFALVTCGSCCASDSEAHALFARIDPTSIKELLLYYSLYPNSPEGEKALRSAWRLLSSEETQSAPAIPANFSDNVSSFVALINPTVDQQVKGTPLSQETLDLVEKIGRHLPNRALRGRCAKDLHEISQLRPEEIDLSRAVLILNETSVQGLATVEASLDILALQILARIGSSADWQSKVSELNRFVFFELGIRFPPLSDAEKKTKNFSDVSSVLFSRRGVCLGASVLYFCLAQRIGLTLSIYTPPGHIFVGYKNANDVRTIETTARGIYVPLDEYYGLTIKYLPERSVKEVVGMVLFNSASVCLHEKNFAKALSYYEKALQFEEGEELFELMSLCHLILGDRGKSVTFARQELARVRPHLLERDILLQDLAQGSLSGEGAIAIVSHTQEDEVSLRQEIVALTSLVEASPKSQALPFHLAHAYLSLGKTREALSLLEKLCAQPGAPASLHALLAQLYLERMNPEACWKEVVKAISLSKAKGSIPRPLREFIIDLHIQYPHPQGWELD